jgi:hypothetical protein
MQLICVSDERAPSFERPDLRLHCDWCQSDATTLSEIYDKPVWPRPSFDLLIAFQDRPKQFTKREILRCYKALPLLRIALVLGPWCDVELRNAGQAAGHVLRFDEAAANLESLVEEFRQGKGVLARPLTSQNGLLPFCATNSMAAKPLNVGVCMGKPLAMAVASCLEALGHLPVVLGESAEEILAVDLIVMDDDVAPPACVKRNGPPIVCLQGFSRSTEGRPLAKTFRMLDLELAVQQAMHRANGVATTPEVLTSR